MRARALAFFAVASVALGAVFACTAFNDAVVREGEGGTNAADAEAGGANDAFVCNSVRLPPPPESVTSNDDTISFTVVLRSMSFTPDGGSPAQNSFDLDESCTCPERETCTPADSGETPLCDYDGGVDNAAGKLISNGNILGYPLTDLAAEVKEGIEKGDNGIVVTVEGYNGQPDDRRVEVSIYRSYGPHDGAGTKITPAFTPDEKWTRRRDDVEAPTRPRSQLAYVRSNVLVALLKTSFLPFKDSFVELQEGRIVATIERRGASYALTNGRIAGRWTTKNFFQNVIHAVPPNNNGKRLCQTPDKMAAFEAPFIKNIVCFAADISSAALDNNSIACDALSVGAGFEAVPVTIGNTVDPATVDPCAGVEVKDCPR